MKAQVDNYWRNKNENKWISILDYLTTDLKLDIPFNDK